MNRKGFAPIIILVIVAALIIAAAVIYFYFYLPAQSYPKAQQDQAQQPTSTQTSTTVAPTSELQKLQELQAQWDATPVLSIAPIPRVLAPMISKTSSELSGFGLSFSVPWTNITTTPKPSAFMIWKFANGNKFVLTKIDNGQSLVSTFQQYHNFQSGYDVYSTALGTVPGTLSSTVSLSDQDLLLKGALLAFKGMNTVGLPTGAKIYSFQTNTTRGFQMGDASASGTTVNFFDANDNQYSMIVQGTQGEIDYILSSLK